MTGETTGDVLLVGSVPLDTVDDVMTTCAGRLGGRLYAMPDGEVGERSTWIAALPHLAYAGNDDLEVVRVVAAEDVRSPSSHDPEATRATIGTFRLRPGVTETTIDLPYAEAAVGSYETFRRLRDEGVIAGSVRFMVALPCTDDGTRPFFPDRDDRPVVARAYERSLQRTVARILDHVPAADLVIQLDYCTEVLAVIAARSPTERAAQLTSTEYLAPMTEIVPDGVRLGFHLCFGTWGGWPIGEVDDVRPVVELANAIVANTPRRVDFVHLPVMPDADDHYFQALADLHIGDTTVFLGLELGDGVDAMCARAEIARRYLSDFGYAHYCGYGRDQPEDIPRLLDDLADGAARLDR